jgi:hypothetical protein
MVIVNSLPRTDVGLTWLICGLEGVEVPVTLKLTRLAARPVASSVVHAS